MEWLLIISSFGGMVYSLKQLYSRRAKDGDMLDLSEVPLSPHEWERFSALAIAMNKQTRTLLAEAVKYYLEEKTK